jgi:hypothetical protein
MVEIIEIVQVVRVVLIAAESRFHRKIPFSFFCFLPLTTNDSEA